MTLSSWWNVRLDGTSFVRLRTQGMVLWLSSLIDFYAIRSRKKKEVSENQPYWFGFHLFSSSPFGIGTYFKFYAKGRPVRLISCNLNNELCRRNSTWAVDFFLVPTFFLDGSIDSTIYRTQSRPPPQPFHSCSSFDSLVTSLSTFFFTV